MRKIIGKKNKVHYVEETTRYKMVKSHKGWLVIGTSMFALGLGVLVTSQPVSAEVVATSTSSSAVLENVTKENFLDYFTLNGSATYDASQGVVTLTTDDNNLVGNFSLKSKIDMNSSFTLTGQVNLGNKVSSNGGADGISFAFHDGNTTDIGNAGGNLGIGGLINAVGFKLDTWHNDNFTPQATVPGAQVSSTDSNGFGWSQDPSNPQFGAFVTTDSEEIKATDEKPYQRWWATTDMSSVKGLSSNNLDNNFHDFVASYDGATRVLTISYTETDGNTLTWTKTIDSSSQAMALIVSASTGGAKNLQQFKITSFDFKQAATVNVKYVDTEGNQIAQSEVTYPNGPNVNGAYSTTQLDIPGYTFIKMGDGSLSASGTLTQAGDNGTVTYVYTKNPVAATTTTTSTTTETTTTTTTTEPTTTSTTTTTVEPTTTSTTTTVEPTTTVAPTTSATVEPTTTAVATTTTVEPTTTAVATTTTVEPTTTAVATTTTVEPATTAVATTTTVEPTTTAAVTTTTVAPTTTAATITTVEPTTTVAPTTSATTTAATTVDVPDTTTGVTPPPVGKKGKTLPKTGEESGLTTSLVGFALMSIAGVAAVLYRKSKKA